MVIERDSWRELEGATVKIAHYFEARRAGVSACGKFIAKTRPAEDARRRCKNCLHVVPSLLRGRS